MQRPFAGAGKKRGLPGLIEGFEQTGGDGRPTSWAWIDQRIMEAYGYRLWECWELTLPEVAVHIQKLLPTTTEPEWFVKGWRKGRGKERLLALKRLTDG